MISIEAKVHGGTPIEDAAREAMHLASVTNTHVDFKFNEVELSASPLGSAKEIVDKYDSVVGNKKSRKTKKYPFQLGTSIITMGVTSDDNYSLTIQEFNGRDCLCVHKCSKVGGLHYSTMSEETLVTAISLNKIARVMQEAKSRNMTDIDLD